MDINGFANQLLPEEINYAVNDIRNRADCCLDNGGATFEPRLKEIKRTHQ